MKGFSNDRLHDGLTCASALGRLKQQQKDDAQLDTEAEPDRHISCQAMGHISGSEVNEWVHPPPCSPISSLSLMHYALWLCLAISPLPNVFTINISILPLSVSIMIVPSVGSWERRNQWRRLKKKTGREPCKQE